MNKKDKNCLIDIYLEKIKDKVIICHKKDDTSESINAKEGKRRKNVTTNNVSDSSYTLKEKLTKVLKSCIVCLYIIFICRKRKTKSR